MSTRLISKQEAAARVGYHPVSLMRLCREGRFPQPVRLAPNKIGFVESEVEAHIAALAAARDTEAA
ncbi:helix-turn-helix transcriptional regulator [Ferruginivarius sediminum]|nr:AlpA family phage regulatory protein [Ferruginivarius sediminum]